MRHARHRPGQPGVGNRRRAHRPRSRERPVRQAIAQHYIEARTLQLVGHRAVTSVMKTGIPGPEGSIMKLFYSELNQRMNETAIDLMGPSGQVENGNRWQYGFLRSRANTIEAGTRSEERRVGKEGRSQEVR